MSRKLRKGFFGIEADAKIGRSWRWLSLFFAVLMITTGCSDDGSTSKTIVTGAVWSDAEETGAIASVTIDDRDMDSARVSVNDVALDYGLPLGFSTEAGLAVDTIVPVYYSDLAPLTSGDAVEFLAKGPGGNILFRHGAIKIPGRPILLNPTDGATLNVNEDVPVRWSEAANAQGYVSGYSESGAFEDAPAPDDDVGFYAEYGDSSSRELIVPFAYTVPGDALFWSTAVSGDVHVLSTEDDTNESYFLAGASGWV